MRISDWSSDVCSSDLPGAPRSWQLRLSMRERFGLFGGERQAPRLEGTGHFLRAFMDVVRTCQWLRHRGRLPLLLPRSARDEGAWPLSGGSAQIGRAHV